MMSSVPFELAYDENNPLDLVEDFVKSKGWTFRRTSDESLNIAMPGQKASFDVNMEWQEEFSALLFACSLPLEIADANYETTAQAMEQINDNLWLGHFDLSNKGVYPTFRHTLLLRMIPTGISMDLITDLLEIAAAECNRFYATFQLAQTGDVRLHDNLNATVFETVGEA